MRPIEEIRRMNQDTWQAVIDRLRSHGCWVLVERAEGEIVSVQSLPTETLAIRASNAVTTAGPGACATILPPTAEAQKTLGDYVRGCRERAARDLPINYGGTD